MRLFPAIAGAMLAAPCGPGPRVGPATSASSAQPSTFSSIEQNIFVPRCASAACHSGNPPSAAPLSLDPDIAYAELVGQPSAQLPGMNRVDPGNPDESYLLLKVLGTAGAVGGVATRMPIGDEPLTDDDLVAIQAWILNGAPND